MEKILLDGNNLTVNDVVKVARKNYKVKISSESKKRVDKANQLLNKWVSAGKLIYGVTTGFGPMCFNIIPQKMAKRLQENLIVSHSCGVGNHTPTDAVRACMLIRLNSLAKGYSGVRFQILQKLAEMINRKVHPVIPELGSVGASGDLAPLSHMALTVIGEGEAEYEGKLMSAKEAMGKAGITPAKLSYKEGLALINSTSMMTALSALAVHDAENLVKTAEITAALGFETLKGIAETFDARIQTVRPHRGQTVTARNILKLLEGSKLTISPKENLTILDKEGKPLKSGKIREIEAKIQDAYSLRCTPQIIGSVRDALSYVKKTVEIELNSATDNPLIFSDDGEYLHGGNFHGQPVSLSMDLLGIAVAELGVLSERRLARLLDKNLSEGLPPFLTAENVGLNSGYMGVQYLPTSLVAENKVLASPVSIESIPTNANNQDIVSMGTIAARKTLKILDNLKYILAVEYLCTCQAVDFLKPENLGRGTAAAYKLLRGKVPPLEGNRKIYLEIEEAANLIAENSLINAVEASVGKLD